MHNLVYWRGGAYLGIGPGAHGRLLTDKGWIATEGIRMPNAWLEAVEQRGSGEKPRAYLTDADRAVEYVMMSLRLAEGSDRGRIPDGVLDQTKLAQLVEDGFLWQTRTESAQRRKADQF